MNSLEGLRERSIHQKRWAAGLGGFALANIVVAEFVRDSTSSPELSAINGAVAVFSAYKAVSSFREARKMERQIEEFQNPQPVDL